MSEFTYSLNLNEQRRPGITAIYWALRRTYYNNGWRDVMRMAKEEWHRRNPSGVPK